jgi:Mn-containing catalase
MFYEEVASTIYFIAREEVHAFVWYTALESMNYYGKSKCKH